jgi:WD40 repeat protein
VGQRSIKIWNALTGTPVRILKNIFSAELDISAVQLDDDHRHIIVGSSKDGEIKVFDILSGRMTQELEGHTKDQGEIAYIGYGKGDDTIITVAWDRKIKVHKDERVAETLQSLN